MRSTIGDPDLRSPSGFDFGLRPPLRMTRKTEMVAQSLDFHRIYWGGSVILRLDFTLDYRRNFFWRSANKKAFSCGRRGTTVVVDEEFPGITYLCRHLIRQPAAATFSHWRRLSFVCAFFVNKLWALFASEWHKIGFRVILSGGRSPESNPEGDRRSGSPIVERTNPVLNLRNGKTPGQHPP